MLTKISALSLLIDFGMPWGAANILIDLIILQGAKFSATLKCTALDAKQGNIIL
jgi:hypothetical protein